MNSPARKILPLLLALLPAVASAAPLTIDLTTGGRPAPTGTGDEGRAPHLTEQFLHGIGATVAGMSAYLPDQMPSSANDLDTLRWTVQADGTSGFLFYSTSPEHTGVQFQLKTNSGTLLVPRQPITLSSTSQGILPFNLPCDGVTLQYATVQPICRIVGQRGVPVYFFAALEGIVPDMVFSSNVNHITAVMGGESTKDEVRGYVANANTAAWVVKQTGGAVGFVVLTPEQAKYFWCVPFAGQDRAILSQASVTADDAGLRLQSGSADDLAFSVFPPVDSVKIGGAPLTGSAAWIFKHFTPAASQIPAATGTNQLELTISPP